MRKVVSFFVKYPIWADSLLVVVAVFGIISLLTIKKSFFPEITPRDITIQVAYPGASPEEMEEGVTIKVEEAIKGIVGIEEYTSTSSENTASISITTFEDYDLDEVLTEVKNAVDRINSFPENAEKPVVFKQKPTSIAAYMGLKGNADLFNLKRAAELVEDDLLNSGVISQVRISGYPDLEISIEVSEEDLRRYNLIFDQVANAVRFNNRDISGGTIKTVDEEIRIRANAKEFDPDILGNIILRANPDGSHLLLNQVATIDFKFADTPNKVFSNSKRAISFTISKLPEEDLMEISSFVDNYVEQFNEANDQIELFLYFDFSTVLKQRLDLLLDNGGIGLLLVLVTLGIFLSLRLSFWVALGIPISFLAMFIVGSSVGITINMLSLFGMILVVGILVDDGIVIAENIYTHFERGKKAHQAAVDGTMEVMPAVFTSVTTTIIAFVPLMLLDNNGFTEEMAIVVISCLAFSLVEAFFILPAHLSNPKVLNKRKEKGAYFYFRKNIDKGINFLRYKLYQRALKSLVRWRWVSVTVPAVFIMLILGMMQGGLIQTTFFPNIPFDDLQINLVLKPGTREHITDRHLQDFEKQVWQINKELNQEYGLEDSVISTIDKVIGASADRTEVGSHAGHLMINFDDLEGKNISSFDVANRIREKIGVVPEADKFSVGGVNRWGKPVSIALQSKNLVQLEGAKIELEAYLDKIAALKDITDNSAVGMREINLQLKPKAYFLGLTHADITRQIRQGFFGEEVQRLQVGPDEVRVWVRYPEKDRVQISQLESMKIKTGLGQEYPLQELADYSIERGIININHFNGKREVRIEADLVDPYEPVPPILEKIETEFFPVLSQKYSGISYSFEGQQRRGARTADSAQKIFPLAFALMILMITLAFRSFYQAALILILVPLGVFCAAFGHFIHQVPVSILSAYGMIALSGVIINDAVVMLDKYNSNLRQGMPIYEAVIGAGVARFRAIIMTSLTTVAGLFPLILEKSFQAQFLIPMAISVAYGVLFGTLFILFFFPVIILVFNDIRVYIRWLLRMLAKFLDPEKVIYKPTHEEVEPAVIELRRQIRFNE